ncbi:uncharacterized protein EAE97_001767 [Botrytis byssoidea]|uniref:Uncharacterized protein n=1 Tax=Botrytis byssoidea TaxID=139641 RepID=A0A9P5IX01_9HELO|nr:uncharacterized protein EAE97_001767 [Botrytis byssoidea]KAF7952270.1 hypothetical protein EAE97_001767 [Botrytis byssoidea]
MRLDRLVISLILVLSTAISADLFSTINQWREAAINLNDLIDDATENFRFSDKSLIGFFKNTTLQNTIFVHGINIEVQQRKALIDLVSNHGDSRFPLQFGSGLIERLTQKVNETLFSINNISSDDPNFEDNLLLNYIAPVNLIRCNQLMPAIGAFWNQTAEILGVEQEQDLPGPLVCKAFDTSSFSYPIG